MSISILNDWEEIHVHVHSAKQNMQKSFVSRHECSCSMGRAAGDCWVTNAFLVVKNTCSNAKRETCKTLLLDREEMNQVFLGSVQDHWYTHTHTDTHAHVSFSVWHSSMIVCDNDYSFKRRALDIVLYSFMQPSAHTMDSCIVFGRLGWRL